MKTPISLILLSATFCCCNPRQEVKTDAIQLTPKQQAVEAITIQPQTEPDTLKGSLKAIASGNIGNTMVIVNYHSPAVRGRVIWGGLVPFQQIWVTGAHKATAVEFKKPVKMGAQTLAAGIYALFTIPSPNEWTILINKNWDQHLTDEYDPNADIIRVLIKPETLSDHQERLMYAVEKSGISLRWEKIRLFIPVSAN